MIASSAFLWLIASMAKERSPQSQDKYIIRMPDGLRERIRKAAEANNRSMNAEIVGTLEAFYPDRMNIEEIVLYLRELAEQYRNEQPPYILDELRHVSELIGETLANESEKDD